MHFIVFAAINFAFDCIRRGVHPRPPPHCIERIYVTTPMIHMNVSVEPIPS